MSSGRLSDPDAESPLLRVIRGVPETAILPADEVCAPCSWCSWPITALRGLKASGDEQGQNPA